MRRRTTVAMLLAELALTVAGSPALGDFYTRRTIMKRRDQRLGMLGAVLLLLAVLCSPGPSHAVAPTDPVLAWNMIMRTTVMSSTVTVTNAFMQGRSASMMHLAVFEAVNAIVGRYEPYLGTIAAPPGASPEAAAIAAAHRTLVLLHPDMEPSLNAARATALAAIAPSAAKDAGIAVGEAAAEAIVHLRANDGAATADLLAYTPGTEPGDYQVTPGSTRARFAGWGQVTTFGIEGGAQFRSVPPPAIHTGTYARDYTEVQAHRQRHQYGALTAPDRSRALLWRQLSITRV